MSIPSILKISIASVAALGIAGTAPSTATPAQAASLGAAEGVSPALCGVGDAKEPGIQGDLPAGKTAAYNCGVRLVAQLPITGNVQGVGKCAYVRGRNLVHVIDVSDPAKPLEVRTVPVQYGSETMRVVVNKERSVLVSGSSVYDIKDCLNPILMGEIKWPPLAVGVSPPLGGGGGSGILPHDLRINHAGTKVYGSMGLWEVDITDLKNPASWKITDLRCDIASQIAGPWQEIHRQAIKFGMNLCDDAAKPNGANYRMGASGVQTVLLWPSLSHSPDVSGDDTRVFVGDQAGGSPGVVTHGATTTRIIDVTRRPVKVLGEFPGPGHGMDWFRVGGRDYVLQSNEQGTSGIAGLPGGDTCKPYPRPTALGWGFEAIISDVTNPARAKNLSMLKIAINNPENCEARKLSKRDPSIAYHLIDDAFNPHFAMVNFGSAGLRFFDIRNPAKPVEVAYFNHGVPVHAGVGYYDAARGLIYASGGGQFWVLEIEPQVRARLGL